MKTWIKWFIPIFIASCSNSTEKIPFSEVGEAVVNSYQKIDSLNSFYIDNMTERFNIETGFKESYYDKFLLCRRLTNEFSHIVDSLLLAPSSINKSFLQNRIEHFNKTLDSLYFDPTFLDLKRKIEWHPYYDNSKYQKLSLLNIQLDAALIQSDLYYKLCTVRNIVLCGPEVLVVSLVTDNWCNKTYEAIIFKPDTKIDSVQLNIDSIKLNGKEINVSYEKKLEGYNLFKIKIKFTDAGLYRYSGVFRQFYKGKIYDEMFTAEFVVRKDL